MRKTYTLIVGVTLLLATIAPAFSQAPLWKPSQNINPLQILHNNDVLFMVKNGIKPAQIIARIRGSRCSFDIFPPVLQDLRRRGVPEAVLEVMIEVPNGPAQAEVIPEGKAELDWAQAKLPQGVGILVETLYPVSSENFEEGNTIAFSVVRPVYIDGVLVVARGTVARAKIVQLRKAQSWGRGGALTWEMESILAVDGTKIPVQLSAYTEGANRGPELAAGVAVTSALIFPYTAPAALVWGFKKGDDAILKGSRQFAAVIKEDTVVSGVVPEKDRVIYHYGETLKAKMSETATSTQFPRMSV